MGNAVICQQCQRVDKQNIDISNLSVSQKTNLQKRQALKSRPPKGKADIEIRVIAKQKDGTYEVLYADGGCYRGEMEKGMRHGKGVQLFEDGIQYNGMWQFNRGHGHGVLRTENFEVQGQFENNKIITGRMEVKKERFTQIYEGQFKDFMYHGNGILTVVGHSRYEGHFLFHKKQGCGKIVYDAGCSYQGQFVNNSFNGKGKYKNEQFEYIGQFKNNKMDGKGICKWKNGCIYEGQFVKGVRSGKVQLKNSKGTNPRGEQKKEKMFDSVYSFGKQKPDI